MPAKYEEEPNGNMTGPGASVEFTPVEPRFLAGPGEPSTIIDTLERAGWTRFDDRYEQPHLRSPDLGLIVAFKPEADEPTWSLRAYRQPEQDDPGHALFGAQPVWEAGFSDLTPPEAILALITELTTPGGYLRGLDGRLD